MRDYAVVRRALLDDLKTQDPYLLSDMDLETARKLWTEKSFWKKFQDEISPDADAKCLELFKQSNERCRTFALDPKSSFEEQVIGEVKRQFDDMFFCGPELMLNSSRIFEGLDIGPGASIDAPSYNFYSKLFDSPLTSTNDHLFRLYREAISSNPSWVRAEQVRAHAHGQKIVVGNRLSFVPKTSAISRSICTEPLLNMFFQKGIGSVLEDMLLTKFKINLSKQPEFNRRLAQIGSIDGKFSTIDLSSASDSVSLILLKEILPPYVYRWLEISRSPRVVFPDGSSEELHMVSSMGNAFTFPLQTLLFSCIVTSCYRVLGIKTEYSRFCPRNFAVFGDDIIVLRDSYHFIVRCLNLFGFNVNDDKSFSCGLFRESCGGDFFRGHDIRGIYIKSLKTRADIYSAVNRIVLWSAKTGILLPTVVSVLRSWVKFLPVPYHAGDTEGIKTPSPPENMKRDPKTGGIVYHAYCQRSNAFLVPGSNTKDWHYHSYGRKGRKVLYNPDGLLISFIGGYIRDSSILLRTESKVFKTRRRVTSRWRGTPDTFFSDCIDRWCRYDRIDARFSSGISEVKSITRPKHLERSVAGSNSLRDDWEVVAGLYFF